ncbi:MAG: hypothetical protein PsegKO_28170 [Pseudohongiellaceae bacterium]
MLWGFPAVYLGWAYVCWLPMLGSDSSVWEMPNLLFFLAGGASPLVAAFLVVGIQGGRKAQLALLRRLVDWRLISVRWLLVLLNFWLVFNLVMAGAALLLGVTDKPFNVAWVLLRDPSALLFLILLSFVFPAVEEIGLRGVYLDALQRRYSTAVAALINGAAWAAWHTPFVWFPGYYANTTFNPQLYWWLPMIVCTTILITQVYRSTGRSIIAVLLFHGMMNFTGELLGISSDMYPFLLSGYVLLALLLLLYWSRSRLE